MASVATFKSAITRIRDILRGPGMSITGMDSMRHICLYLLSRYMTKEKVASLGVPDEFAWETLIETAQTKNGGVQKALDCFYHPEEDCLVRHFDRLFGTDKFSFDIKNPQKHKEILEILNGVTMSDVDCQMDILGWVYELHLKTGSSTAGRDLGQFFTDRFICEYMTELCAPGFKHAGVPESVCDPSMGTGGFLTSFIKYYKKHHADTPINWAVQQKEIHGNDTDPRVAGVARLNLFMETGGSCSTNLLTHDSLYGDLTQTGYDVILANMPFGLKGIKHAECCERVKELKIRGTKSEPLFLQLMMVSLNRGGRCAVVVPDGMLVNSSECHDGTRKYLLDHFELKRVIKMRGQFFMNTGIQPSILFFENTGNPTTAVEFWDVVKAANGSIEETMVLSVSRDKLDASCSLDMRRYQETKEVANSAGFPMVKLRDVCKVSFGDRITQKDNTGTIYPVYGSGGDTFKTDNHNRLGKTCKVGRFALSESNMVMIVNGPYWLMDSGFTVESKQPEMISTEYLWYCLLMDKKRLATLSTGSCQKNIDMDGFYKVEYSCPPLAVQQEIVATLDRVYQPGTTELAETLKLTNQAMDLVLAQPNGATLEPIVEAQRLMRKSAQMVADVKAQMVADVKAQMVAIVKSVGSRGFEMVKLGDLFETPSIKKRYTNKDSSTIGIPFYNGCYNSPLSCIDTNEPSYSSPGEYLIMIKDGGGDHNSPTVGLGKAFIVSGEVCVASQNVVLAPKSECILKYVHYILSMKIKELRDLSKKSINLEHLSIHSIMDFPIPLPPIAFQHALVARLDALQSQLTALENLGKQAEDNARFILESYLGSANNSAGSSEVQSHSSTCHVNEDGTGCTCRTSEVVQEDAWSDSGVNEVIHPVEPVASVAAASSEVKVVKCKKPTLAKTKK
jgi:restriction endonuclease S subunit